MHFAFRIINLHFSEPVPSLVVSLLGRGVKVDPTVPAAVVGVPGTPLFASWDALVSLPLSLSLGKMVCDGPREPAVLVPDPVVARCSLVQVQLGA